jgi:spore maturation protein CgeB
VPYDQVKEILYCSDLLLHVESFDEFYQEDLKFAFSTKIADSLSSGTCFLLYAPEKLACSKYLIANEVAYVVSDCKKLKSVLELLVGSEKARKRYLSRAIELAEQNHRCEKNIQKFQNILRKL